MARTGRTKRKRHVEANALRSAREINRLLDVHVLPVWKDREFTSIRRSDVAALLDEVEDGHSARQADYVLNVVRSITRRLQPAHRARHEAAEGGLAGAGSR